MYDDHYDVREDSIPWKDVVNEFKEIKFCGPFISECFKLKSHEAKDALIKYYYYQMKCVNFDCYTIIVM
jgi:sugar phosphate isomerase/epimerase